MAFKINIGTPEGKTYKIESNSESLVGKSLGEKVSGKDLGNEDLNDYEFEITGASDKSGIPALKEVEGFTRKRVLLKYGKGMHKRPKREGKKERPNPTPGGLRLRKTLHGKTISENIVQVNLKPTKEGSKKLTEIFGPKPEENTSEDKKE